MYKWLTLHACIHASYVDVRIVPLFVVDAGQVPVHRGVVWAQAPRPEVGGHRPVKYPGLLQDVPQVDVGIQERGVQLYSLCNA